MPYYVNDKVINLYLLNANNEENERRTTIGEPLQ